MDEWNIQSRGHCCGACGKAFLDKQHYHTLLFDDDEDFRRSDVCPECWLKDYSEGARDRKGFISYWQGVYEAPAPVPEPIQKETAETLLRKLIELNDPKYIPAGYILAVMLERKRILKVKEQVMREEHRVFIYEHSRSGDIFTIVDPALQLDQLQQVQHDVAELLEQGLNPPASSQPAPEAGAAENPESDSGDASAARTPPVEETATAS